MTEVVVVNGVEFGVDDEGTIFPLGDSTPSLVRESSCPHDRPDGLVWCEECGRYAWRAA